MQRTHDLHAKTAVADGRWARVGSTNLNISSWFGNYELDVAVEDVKFALEMEDMYLEDLKHSTEILLSKRHRVRLAADRPRRPNTIVPASAPPDEPRPLYIVPTFRWTETPGAGSLDITRLGNGLRVWLERPWFSSGDGELLGVVILGDNRPFTDISSALVPLVTQWGLDPLWDTALPKYRTRVSDFPARVTDEEVHLQEMPEQTVRVVGHRVHWDNDRGLWYCDIELDPGRSYMPFVRLALVRYQPNAIEDEANKSYAKISKVVLAEFAQVLTTPEDMLEVSRRLSWVKGARYLLAATFGNVHGVYKPGQVKLEPSILKERQEAVQKALGKGARFALVFYGGSGSALEEIREAVDYGVVKMNIDTDTQYAFTRPIVDHMMKNYEGVLKIEGEVGNKEKYDPRSYMKLGEAALAERVKQAVTDMRGVGTTLFGRGR